jgi:anti-sigma B factor antagonist
MAYLEHKVNDVIILKVEGRLIMGEPVQALRAQVKDLLDKGTMKLAVDLTGVTYIDSSGVGALTGVHVSAEKAGVECRFFGVQYRVMTILKVVHLDKVISFLPDETSALLSLRDGKSTGPDA